MSLDLRELEDELIKIGTDERVQRAVMVLARHVQKALDLEMDDRIDERIERDASRREYWRNYDY